MSGELYTVEQAADRLKLHAKTVLRMIREGRLKAVRLGSTLTAMLGGRQARTEPVTLQTAYDPILRRVKVVVIGSPEDVATLLKSVVFLMDSWR